MAISPLDREIKTLYRKHTLHEISGMTGLHFTTISKRLNKMNVKMRPRGNRRGPTGPRDLKRHARIVKMMASGLTQKEMAKRLNLSHQSVSQYINYHRLNA